jgi:hypothetical protein
MLVVQALASMGRPHFYAITRAGHSTLQGYTVRWRRLAGAMDKLLVRFACDGDLERALLTHVAIVADEYRLRSCLRKRPGQRRRRSTLSRRPDDRLRKWSQWRANPSCSLPASLPG